MPTRTSTSASNTNTTSITPIVHASDAGGSDASRPHRAPATTHPTSAAAAPKQTGSTAQARQVGANSRASPDGRRTATAGKPYGGEVPRRGDPSMAHDRPS